MLDLQGKAAIITGAGAGIGKSIALLFAKQGAAVTLIARRKATLDEVAKEIESFGGKALVIAGDVTDPQLPRMAVEKTVEAFGTVDILVNNAGIADCNKSVKNCSDELWDACVSLNEIAPLRLCREFVKLCNKEHGGRIVNISSIGGSYSMAGISYSASKKALIGLSKNIAMEFAGKGIRCNCLCPGPTLTDMIKGGGAPADIDKEMETATCKHLDPEAGPSEPEDMANVALFLASDESCGINGQCIVVDRGLCL